MAAHLVIGGSGFLGRTLLSVLGSRGYGTFSTHAFAHGVNFDSRHDRLSTLIRQIPDTVTHVHLLHGIVNPDECARDPVTSRTLNVDGMQRLIAEIWDLGLTPVYLSTDYVYDGTRGGRAETDATCPTTEYGCQKAEMEGWLQDSGRNYLIARSSKIVSAETDTHSVIGQWAVDFLSGREVRAATDQIFSPMHVADTARAIIELADKGQTGLFNVAGEPPFSRFELAQLLADEIMQVSPTAAPVLSSCRLAEIPFLETRPLNTSLSVTKLQRSITTRFVSMRTICAAAAALFSPLVR